MREYGPQPSIIADLSLNVKFNDIHNIDLAEKRGKLLA
jgi:hypothetical protein